LSIAATARFGGPDDDRRGNRDQTGAPVHGRRPDGSKLVEPGCECTRGPPVSLPGCGDDRNGNDEKNGVSFASTPSVSALFGATLNAGVNGVPPARARSSMSTTSSAGRRPFGKPAVSPPSRPRRLGLRDGATAMFSRIISAGRGLVPI